MKLKIPKCELCKINLESTPSGLWRCPSCTFFYQVFRGVVVGPIWRVSAEAEAKSVEKDFQDAFKQYLLAHGWTKEKYESLSDEGKRLLFERWKETAGL